MTLWAVTAASLRASPEGHSPAEGSRSSLLARHRDACCLLGSSALGLSLPMGCASPRCRRDPITLSTRDSKAGSRRLPLTQGLPKWFLFFAPGMGIFCRRIKADGGIWVMPRRHPLAPGMSHHAGTAAGVGTAAPGCCGVLGVGGSAWLFLAGCCGAQEGTSCLPAPAFLLLLLLLSSPALNLVTMATVSTTLQLPREDLPRGGGEREAGGGCWGHGDIALGTAVTLPRCGTVPAHCVPWDEHCASCLGGAYGLISQRPSPLHPLSLLPSPVAPLSPA